MKTFPAKSNSLFNPKESRSDFYNLNEDKFIELFKPIVKVIRKYKKDGEVLDIGCSSGILLYLLKKVGFEVMGIEPNKIAYSKARNKLGGKAFHGTLKDFLKNHKNKYDCIIYNHVLEHVKNPINEISLAKKILKKDGILLIGTPNTSNVIFYLRKKYWESLMPNEHIWHFNTSYLINLFRKLGLNPIGKFFFDDERQDYSLKKRVYFKILSLINKITGTGEAVLIIFILSE